MSKVLILGSGLHRQVLGSDCSPLGCWCALMHKLAGTLDLPVNSSPAQVPILFWEELVGAICERDGIAAGKAEQRLRRKLSNLLESEEGNVKHCYASSKVSTLLKHYFSGGGHLIYLNCDLLIHGLWKSIRLMSTYPEISKQSRLRKENLSGIYRRYIAQHGGGTVHIWPPHGDRKCTKTLRFGLRDYGLMPAAYSYAFDQFKAWERRTIKDTSGSKIDQNQYDHLVQELEALDQHERRSPLLHDHWIARFMLYPITIIGAGLSASEMGLHWLITQRERNLARVPVERRPKLTFYSDKVPDNPFLSKHHVRVQDWCAAWQEALT